MPKTLAQLQGKTIALDARPDRLDLRDLPYRPPACNLPPQHPAPKQVTQFLPNYREAKLILNQGQEGACTGFGLAATVNYLLWLRSEMTLSQADRVSPRMIYQLAKYYDEWPDENYEGSSCRGALKGWHKHGVCTELLWPYAGATPNSYSPPKEGWDKDATKRPLGVYYRLDRASVVDMQSAIHNMGAIYVSANVHEGWMHVAAGSASPTHDNLPLIQQTDEIVGGHAFALVGYNERGFIVQNSWGESWGCSGFAIMSYQDWVENGTDAWVVGLGVPIAGAAAAPKHRVSSEHDQPQRPGGSASHPAEADELEKRPDAWDRAAAYNHTVVTGNNGKLLNRMPHLPSPRANAELVCRTMPAAALAKAPTGQRHVVLYLHGGLNDEDDSIQRVRVLGPVFERNGIYPLFLTWKSGWLETVGDMLSDNAASIFGQQRQRGIGDVLKEAWDRSMEVMVREVMVRSMWTEMKQNVLAGDDGDANAGLSVLAEQLLQLRQDLGGDLKIHLVGHSAGSYGAGSVLKHFTAVNQKVDSCSLFAPACTVDFALSHYKPAIGTILSPQRFKVQVLADHNELDDSVGPYGKSLLYLVSRALENQHKTPILGLANAFDPAHATEEFWHKNSLQGLRDWQAAFTGDLHLVQAPQVSNGPCLIKSTHGSFDNSVDAIVAAMENILQGPPPAPGMDLRY